MDAAFYPNPYSEGKGYVTFRLSAPATRVRLKIFTASGRGVLEKEKEARGYGGYEHFVFEGIDSLGNMMANGVYLFMVEAYDGSMIMDRRIGKLVILR